MQRGRSTGGRRHPPRTLHFHWWADECPSRRASRRPPPTPTPPQLVNAFSTTVCDDERSVVIEFNLWVFSEPRTRSSIGVVLFDWDGRWWLAEIVWPLLMKISALRCVFLLFWNISGFAFVILECGSLGIYCMKIMDIVIYIRFYDGCSFDNTSMENCWFLFRRNTKIILNIFCIIIFNKNYWIKPYIFHNFRKIYFGIWIC